MSTIETLKLRGLCEVCRRWTHGALCADCVHRHAMPVARCDSCALRVMAKADRCGACLRESPPFERTRCAVDYAFPWAGLIGAFKFNGRIELASTLARLLGSALDEDADWPELIVPVPLAPARLRERGYNQAWEIARRLARALDKPAQARVLARPNDGAHQVALGHAARQRALRGAFVVVDADAIAGRRVALVDDVITTGATAAAASRALLAGGAAGVHLWVLARTA